MSLRQKAIRATLWSAIEKWGAQLVSTAIFLLLARLLGAEAFGLVALANVFLAFMQIFLDQGFAQAIIQKDELESEHLDTAFWTSVLMGALFVLLIFSGAGWVANFYREPELAPIIRWMSLSFLFGGLSSVQAAILQRNMQFKIFAARSLVATLACGIAGVGAALMGLGVWSLVVKELVYGFSGALLLWSTSRWRPGLRFSPSHFRELFLFGINIVGFNFLNFFYRRSDDMLIGYFLGAVALGYYSVAYKLLLIMIKLLTATTAQVALPAFSRLQKEPEKIRQAFYQVTQLTSFVAFPAFLGFVALAPELIGTVFGEQWLPSVFLARMLALTGVLQSIYAFNGTILLAVNKPLWRLVLQGINVFFSVAVFFFVVRWGLAAVAIGYAIRGYLLSPLPLFLLKKLIDIDIKKYFWQFASPAVSSAVMVLSIFGLKLLLPGEKIDGYFALTLYGVVGCITYASAVLLTYPNFVTRVKKIFAV